jgi:hypothetical protein
MNRTTIEENDRNLIKKFRQKIQNNDKKNTLESSSKKKGGKSGLIPGVLIIIVSSVAAIIIFRATPDDVVNKNPNTSTFERVNDVSLDIIATEGDNFIKKSDVPGVEEKSEESAESVLQPTEKNVLNVSIQEILSCSGVDEKQYVKKQTVFSLKESPTPVIWMNVLSNRQPFILKHAYYLNGRKYCEVPLTIRYPRMRTWSHVSLKNQQHLGKWHVEVITDQSKTIGAVDFLVVP